MGLRVSIPPRRAAAVLLVVATVVALTVSRAIADASATVATADATAAHTTFAPPIHTSPHVDAGPRVLLMGDSVMDQQGSAAAFLLRQAGVDAKTVGLWGTGLLTVDQYDRGVTKPSGLWLARATREIAHFDPDVVGVYLNHNYWPPYPRDAAGRPITDLWSVSGQAMIAQQARALVRILRARGADVFFVAPVPEDPTGDPSPAAWNPIWHGYLPALRELHVPIADTTRVLGAPDGHRAETKPSCDGSSQPIHPPGDLHLTRFGAGLAGTALAAYVAARVHADLRGNAAPGDRVAALAPTADGRGYWLVGCDGSVYHFGDAPPVDGARAALAGHGGVVAATSTPDGRGLWLVAADGTIANVGDAPPLAWSEPPAAPLVAATGVPGHEGLWSTDASGRVLAAGAVPALGGRAPAGRHGPVVGISATPDGEGAWLATRDGALIAVGDAPAVHTAARPGAAVVGITAAPSGHGCWLVTTDGNVIAAGDAQYRGDAVYRVPPYPYRVVNAAPGPAVGIVTASRPAGYWVFGTTGRVVGRGSAWPFGGSNNLAMFTQ